MAELTGAPVAGRAMRSRSFALPEPLVLITCAAVAVGILLRAVLDAGLPLWVDETWTGGVAGQETFALALQQTLLDANAPLYYLLMHVRSQLFGLSNAALRAPSLLFGIAAIFVALIPAPGIGRQVRLIWCALAAVWIPALSYAQEARCYSLLFCLAMACTVAYARLLAAPDLRRAAIWSGLAALAVLTHYHALLLVGLQGLGYLAMHRTKAIRTWPAALAFVPVFAWIGIHAPRILQFSDPGATWISRLTVSDTPGIIEFIFGDLALAIASTLVIVIALAARNRLSAGASFSNASKRTGFATWMVVGTAILGAAILIVLGMLRPSLTPRYLMSFMPGILLGFAMGIAWLGRRWALAPMALLSVAIATAVASPFGGNRPGKILGFEQASRALMAAGATRIVFLWDNPMTRIYDPSQLDATGGFFFRRAGRPVTVEPVQLRPDDDPNARLVAAAEPGSAILWLYDMNVPATAARTHPPRIEQLDPAWRCADFGRGPFGVIACTRDTARS